MGAVKDTLHAIDTQEVKRRALAAAAVKAYYDLCIARRSSPFAVSRYDSRVLVFSDKFAGEVERHVVAIDKDGFIYFDNMLTEATEQTVESFVEALQKAQLAANKDFLALCKIKRGSGG